MPETRHVLDKALEGSPLSKREAIRLMRCRSIEDTFSLFTTASRVNALHFGNQVFLYGFVYFSTYCRKSCAFCFYRKTNIRSPRYRKDPEEVAEMAERLDTSGVHLIDLTMGEDPLIHDGKRYDLLVKVVKAVKDRVGAAIMVSPGVLPRKVLKSLKEAGADWYALYQETHNKKLYSALRLGQRYDERIMAKIQARREGLLIEEGILLGVGESDVDRVDSIFAMKRLGVSQVRAMGFIPQEGSPMEGAESPPIIDEMKTMAVMRLVNQDKLMPASFDIDGVKGLELRLASGANVVSSIIPPSSGLAGVAQPHLGVDEGLRTVESVRPFIERLGLRVASKKSYLRWVDEEKELQSAHLKPERLS
jgi:methylornithine synthase